MIILLACLSYWFPWSYHWSCHYQNCIPPKSHFQESHPPKTTIFLIFLNLFPQVLQLWQFFTSARTWVHWSTTFALSFTLLSIFPLFIQLKFPGILLESLPCSSLSSCYSPGKTPTMIKCNSAYFTEAPVQLNVPEEDTTMQMNIAIIQCLVDLWCYHLIFINFFSSFTCLLCYLGDDFLFSSFSQTFNTFSLISFLADILTFYFTEKIEAIIKELYKLLLPFLPTHLHLCYIFCYFGWTLCVPIWGQSLHLYYDPICSHLRYSSHFLPSLLFHHLCSFLFSSYQFTNIL